MAEGLGGPEVIKSAGQGLRAFFITAFSSCSRAIVTARCIHGAGRGLRSAAAIVRLHPRQIIVALRTRSLKILLLHYGYLKTCFLKRFAPIPA